MSFVLVRKSSGNMIRESMTPAMRSESLGPSQKSPPDFTIAASNKIDCSSRAALFLTRCFTLAVSIGRSRLTFSSTAPSNDVAVVRTLDSMRGTQSGSSSAKAGLAIPDDDRSGEKRSCFWTRENVWVGLDFARTVESRFVVAHPKALQDFPCLKFTAH